MKTSTKIISGVIIVIILIVVALVSRKSANAPLGASAPATETNTQSAVQSTPASTIPAASVTSGVPANVNKPAPVAPVSTSVVTAPKSGDILIQGQSYTIHWAKSAFSSDQVAITLVDSNGACVFCTTNPITYSNDGTNVYTPPLVAVSQTQMSSPWVPANTGYRLMFKEYPDRVGHTSKSYLSAAFYIRAKTQ